MSDENDFYNDGEAYRDPSVEMTLTDWEKEPSVEDLKSDLQAAQSDHQKQVTIIDKYMDNLEGKPNFKVRKGQSKVVPKVIRKQAEWRYSALSEPFLSTDDLFDAKPSTWEDVDSARQNGLILNHQFNNEMDKVEFIDEYVRTVTDEGTCVLKTGWEFDSVIEMVEEPVYEMVPVLDNQKALAMIEAGQEPLEQVQVGVREVEKEVIKYNRPTVEVCDYRNVIIDPTAKGNVKKARFIIHRFETDLSELKKDGRYHNLQHVVVDESKSEVDTEEEPDFAFSDKSRKKIWVYEYWGFKDIDGSGINKPFVCSWVGNVKVRCELNPFPDEELPFVVVKYLPKRRKNYGEPDGYLLEDNQYIVGAVTRGMIDIMARSANAQVGIRKDALDTINSRRFEKGDDYKFNSNVDPRQAFHMGTYPEIPNSAMLMIQHQNNEAEALTGVKAFSGGISGDALGKQVANARIATDAAGKRELGILRRLSNGLIAVGRKFTAMNREFLSEVEVVRITEDDFAEIRRDDLGGKFDLRLSISTAEADDAKAQELSFMLQTTGQTMPGALQQKILGKIARLRKMPDLAKDIEEYQPQPDPLAQMQAQLQVVLLKAQVFNERAKAQENQVDVGLKQAKTMTEQAKARQMHSTSDKIDLDFLEQDSGVQHQREIDLKDFDRRSKLDEKAADKLLSAGDEAQNAANNQQDTSFLEDFQL